MPEVSIQGLTTGQCKKHRGKQWKGMPPLLAQKSNAFVWAQSHQHLWVLHDRSRSKNGKRKKPCHHHWPKKFAHMAGAKLLDRKQATKNQHRQRHRPMRKHRRTHRQTLDRTEHRDRRSQHAIGINQRRTGQAQKHDLSRILATQTFHRATDQCRQGKNPALAAVVKFQDDK